MGEVSPETSPKNTMIQDMINSETIWIQLNRQTQTYSSENFCLNKENRHWYLEKHLNSRIFHFYMACLSSLPGCFGASSLKSLCFSIDFVCWLAESANHNIEKRKFWKPIISKQKVIEILKKLLLCRDLSDSINNFVEFSLKKTLMMTSQWTAL